MTAQPIHYYCGESAIDYFARYCAENKLGPFMLVCDQNTYPILGQQVEANLKDQGFEVRTLVLTGEEVIADEEYLIQVLLRADANPCTYLAVGSGTITDITRFCSHRTRNPFISLPTAPSVDGFASVIAPLVVRRFKDTAWAQPPIAIFADLDTLCAAPQPMIAAGFGDMLGKYTALSDWKLAHLLWDEPYNEEIADRMRKALNACIEAAGEVGQAAPGGISRLMDGLVESGLCMLLNGNSRPASGAEHHLSHFWELKLLHQGRPAVLHGAKVGIGTVLIARRYEQIRALSREEVSRRLQDEPLPNREAEAAAIEAAYGSITPQIINEQQRYLELNQADLARLKERICSRWDEILSVAAEVPPAARIIELLEKVAGPVNVRGIGLDDQDEAEALQVGHYLRSQFTVTKLGRFLKLW